MSDNYRFKCNFDILNLIDIEDMKGDILKNNSKWNICIDSRCVRESDIFLALKGKYADGHKFLSQAFQSKASAAIISNREIFEEADLPLIYVKDTFKALAKIADYNFRSIETLKIAITGSVGKTTTKDYLQNILSNYETTFSAPESFNNELGITISKAKLSKMDKYAIFEVGMNMKDEIGQLSSLINPDIAVITNIAEAHIGNLGSIENIAIEKSNIIEGMPKDGIVFLPRDSDFFELLLEKASKKKLRCITFGHSKKSDIQLSKVSRHTGGARIEFRVFGEVFETYSSMQNKSILNNYLPVLGIASLLNYDPAEALKDITKSSIHKSRWQEHDFEFDGGKIKLIDDSYNASPTSMFEAIKAIDDYESDQILRKIIIIGDMLELGKFNDKYHRKLVDLINNTNIDHVYFCGEYLATLFARVSPQKRKKQFRSIKNIFSIEDFSLTKGDLIFIKGGNKIGLNHLAQEFINYLELS